MCCLAITIITAIIIYLSACLILLDFVNRVCVQLIVFNITKTRFAYEHCTVTDSICSTLFQSLFFSFVRGQRRDERGRGYETVKEENKKIMVSVVAGSALDHLRPKPKKTLCLGLVPYGPSCYGPLPLAVPNCGPQINIETKNTYTHCQGKRGACGGWP